MTKYEILGLSTLDNGGAIDKFDYELGKAIENCRDPNTDTKKVRTVTLTVKLMPDPERKKVGVTYAAASKLPGDSPGEDHVLLTRDKAFVDNARQTFIDGIDEQVGRIEEKFDEKTGEQLP